MKFFAAAAAFLASTVIAAPAAAPIAESSLAIRAEPAASGATGKIIQDLAPEVDRILTITGPNAKTLLIKLSPEVAALVDGLGLVGIGAPVGAVVASASSVGDLLKNLGPKVDGLLTVIGDGTSVLLIQLSGPVAALVSGLGLPAVGIPVGTVVATLGQNIKRSSGKLLEDLAPKLDQVLVVTGQDAQKLLIELSPEVAALVAGLGLFGLAAPIGAVVASASSVGELVQNLGPQVEGLVIVLGQGTGALLIQLSGPVAALVSGLGLPSVGIPVGAVVATLGANI